MPISMRLTYDATLDVAYLALRPAGSAVLGPTLLLESDRAFGGAVAMDFGLRDGLVVGFEFQIASRCLPAELLSLAERVDGRALRPGSMSTCTGEPGHLQAAYDSAASGQ